MNYKAISLISCIFFGFLLTYSESCSCLLSHPQTDFCRADFVILARIRKEVKSNFYRIYKARIRKEFKMSEKARVALKSGRLQTPFEDSMCGVSLYPGQLYLITGAVYGLQAHISLCSFHSLWNEISPRQRKGLKLLYNKGCSCQISYYHRYPAGRDHCVFNNVNCQSKYGICLRSPSGQCHWSKSLDLKKCIKGDFVSLTTTLKSNIDHRLSKYNSANTEQKFHQNNVGYKPS